MRILVPTKRVADPDGPVTVRPDGACIDDSALGYVMNPFDAIALEEALRIRDRSEWLVEITVVALGDAACESVLRTALAMGADRALFVSAPASLDPWCVASLLAALVRREQPDLVLMGKLAIDDDSNQAGQMLAGLLDWPQATFASRIDFVAADSLHVARETDLGLETVGIRLPAVVTTDLRLNEPRYAPLPALMKAKKRPIESISYQELGVTLEPKVRVMRLDPATIERICVRVQDAAELVHRLRYEAKII